jgi:hypothetical protein
LIQAVKTRIIWCKEGVFPKQRGLLKAWRLELVRKKLAKLFLEQQTKSRPAKCRAAFLFFFFI